MNVEEAVNSFNAYLQKQNLKLTRQRSLITEVFFDPERRSDHPTVEALYMWVKQRDERIGYATIYRTLKLLVDSGLAIPNRIGEDHTRYEPKTPGEHHDHMICDECHLIVEFEDEEIERLQDLIAERLGFSLLDHNMNLIGRPMNPCTREDCLRTPHP
jgi:Fur family transcriptional regulator, ferric uptake regulator